MNYTQKKFDRRRKYYLILDCETATLPYAHKLESADQKQKIAIAKPLIYDIGWQIVDRQGRVYERMNFLISEIFSVPEVFDTAYYAWKRPLYIDKLNKGEIELTDWRTAINYLQDALNVCEAVGAYNAMFDFKKALPFTELYVNRLYSTNFHEWLKEQAQSCETILKSRQSDSNPAFDPDNFLFRGRAYPLFDIWGLACTHLLNNDEYKRMCLENKWLTASGKYFKTSAETAYRYFKQDTDFEESHTALDDAIIESELFGAMCGKNKDNLIMGLIYFPFKKLGEVENFMV